MGKKDKQKKQKKKPSKFTPEEKKKMKREKKNKYAFFKEYWKIIQQLIHPNNLLFYLVIPTY